MPLSRPPESKVSTSSAADSAVLNQLIEPASPANFVVLRGEHHHDSREQGVLMDLYWYSGCAVCCTGLSAGYSC